MSSRIKICEYCGGEATPFDGQFVVEYDPKRPSVAPDGTKLPFHLVTTPDPGKAKVYGSPMEALAVWRQEYGIRPWDGEPNRPLTAWTVAIL